MSALKIAEMFSGEVTVKTMLERYERAKILEVYFARVDNRVPVSMTLDDLPLYEVDLVQMKSYLLGKYPEQNIFTKLFKIMMLF